MALMIFVMIYAPCVATVVMIAKETGTWRWAAFSLAYNTVLGLSDGASGLSRRPLLRAWLA
jgi:Fe2+ transport system protein B